MIKKIFVFIFAASFSSSSFASQPLFITYDIATDMRLKPYEHFIAGDTFFLRPFFPEDRVAFRPIFTDQKVMQYFASGKTRTEQEIEALTKRIAYINASTKPKFIYWAIINAIGICGFTLVEYPTDEQPENEIGYAINPQFSGNGLATRAATAVMRYIKGPFMATVHPKNIASQRVLTKLGLLPNLNKKDVVRYGTIRDYWYLKRINL
jgi:ribosomal-protein-alanine N-acetyltransferase